MELVLVKAVSIKTCVWQAVENGRFPEKEVPLEGEMTELMGIKSRRFTDEEDKGTDD